MQRAACARYLLQYPSGTFISHQLFQALYDRQQHSSEAQRALAAELVQGVHILP